MSEAGLLADPAEVRAILVASAQAGESITYAETLDLLGHRFSRAEMRGLGEPGIKAPPRVAGPIEDWRPEDAEFWRKRGRAVARWRHPTSCRLKSITVTTIRRACGGRR